MKKKRSTSIRVVAGFTGSLLLILGSILLVPLAFALINGEGTVAAFLVPSILCFSAGLALRPLSKGSSPGTTQALLICATGWIVLSAFGALPFVMGLGADYIDSYFETMSGFTTTGITLFTGLDSMPGSIILWRSITQWVGGLGILTFFLAVSSRIPGAHLLFGAESHKIASGRPVPGMQNTVKILWTIYAGFTITITLLLLTGGMSLFDSINHSMTALSTGGFSPHDASIGYYSSAVGMNHVLIEWVIILGMVLGGTSFIVHYRLLTGRVRSLVDTSEMRLWWILITVFAGLVLLDHSMQPGTGELSGSSLRTSLFQTVSILTTTGFSTQDIGTPFFGVVSRQLFLLMMVIGGCVGSTSGGVKVQRVVILFKMAGQQIRKLMIPRRAVNRVIVDGAFLDESEANRVSSIFFLWMFMLFIGGGVTAALSSLGGYQSFSGMFSAMGNIGPCFISVEQMASLTPAVKVVYILGMLAGRLEILPVLLLLSPRAWRS